MCLKIAVKKKDIGKDGKPIPKKAEKDIKVYKLLQMPSGRGKIYLSPTFNYKYERGMHYYQVPDEITDKNGFSMVTIGPISGGMIFGIHRGIHVYAKKPGVQTFGNFLRYIEMIIPKGSLYYTGYGKQSNEIVTNNLIFPAE